MNSRPVRIFIAAILLPFGMVTVNILLEEYLGDRLPWFGTNLPVFASVIVGSALLRHALGRRALLLLVAYMPLMWLMLVFYSFAFVGYFYGDTV